MEPAEQPAGTDLEPVETAVELVDRDPVDQLVAAWLLGFKSKNTVRAYGTDLADWRAFCASTGVDPLMARRPHVDAWARVLEASGLKDRSLARRLSGLLHR